MTIIPDWDGRSDSADLYEEEMVAAILRADSERPEAIFANSSDMMEWLDAPSRPRIVDDLLSFTFAAILCAGVIGYLLVR